MTMTTPSKSFRARHHPAIRRIATAVAACSLILGASACGKVSDKVGDKIAEKSIEAGTGGDAKIDADTGEFSIDTGDGEFSTKSTDDVPKGWPADVLPLPDGFGIVNVTESKTPEGETNIVRLEGRGDVGELIDLYAGAFESNGVEIALQTKSGDSGMISGHKGDVGYQVMVGGDDDGRTTLNLSATATAESGG